MTVLTDADITDRIRSGDLGVDPFDPACVQPASLDFRIADEWAWPLFRIQKAGDDWFQPSYLDLACADQELAPHVVQNDHVILMPNQFVLARTQEVYRFPNDLGGKVWTRSSLARLGLRVANDGGWIDPGFWGSIVLEVRNDGPIPIKIPAGMRVGQITFFKCDRQAAKPYSGSYSGQFDFNVAAWKNSLKKAAVEAAERVK